MIGKFTRLFEKSVNPKNKCIASTAFKSGQASNVIKWSSQIKKADAQLTLRINLEFVLAPHRQHVLADSRCGFSLVRLRLYATFLIGS
jgi:hypothetical protein